MVSSDSSTFDVIFPKGTTLGWSYENFNISIDTYLLFNHAFFALMIFGEIWAKIKTGLTKR